MNKKEHENITSHDHCHNDHCNHEHNHEDHDCHHDHNHEDHDCHDDHCNHDHAGIESHMHEDAAVVSGKREINGSVDIIREKLSMELKQLAQWVEERGGVIGHIKAYIEGGGMGYMLSTTGDEVQCKENPSSTVHINVAAIVFNIELPEMECRLADLFGILN